MGKRGKKSVKSSIRNKQKRTGKLQWHESDRNIGTLKKIAKAEGIETDWHNEQEANK